MATIPTQSAIKFQQLGNKVAIKLDVIATVKL